MGQQILVTSAQFGDATLELLRAQRAEVEADLVRGVAQHFDFVRAAGLAVRLAARQDEAVGLAVVDAGECEFTGEAGVGTGDLEMDSVSIVPADRERPDVRQKT